MKFFHLLLEAFVLLVVTAPANESVTDEIGVLPVSQFRLSESDGLQVRIFYFLVSEDGRRHQRRLTRIEGRLGCQFVVRLLEHMTIDHIGIHKVCDATRRLLGFLVVDRGPCLALIGFKERQLGNFRVMSFLVFMFDRDDRTFSVNISHHL